MDTESAGGPDLEPSLLAETNGSKHMSAMGGCLSYLLLFLGWLLLNVATFGMVTVPSSSQFLDIEPQLPEEEKYIVFGLWVLIEIALFFVLLVAATIIMCTCKNVPPGAGFVHLMVDPSLVTLAFTPFLVIRGLPRAASIHYCLQTLTSTPNSSRVDALLGPQEQGVPYSSASSSSSSSESDWTQLPAQGEPYVVPWDVGVGLVSGTNCVDLLSHWIQANASTWEEGTVLDRELEEQLDGLLVQWVSMLQCAVILPVLLRMFRYRWKMSWQPFLHSNLYFFLQALDVALLMETFVRAEACLWSVAVQSLIYITTLAICIGCLTVAIPPVYVGNQITNKYIKTTSYIGTALLDAPFLVLRLLLVHRTQAAIDMPTGGLFFIFVVKEMVCIAVILSIVCRKVSLCVGSTYLSLNVQDMDFEDFEPNEHEMEEYV